MKKIHITLAQLQAFAAVIEAGSFTAASEQLGMTQSAVSHAIATLENELQISLIERDPRRNRSAQSGMRLTAIGDRAIRLTRDILLNAEQIQQEAAAAVGLEAGKIRLGSFPSVSARFLPGLLRQFQQRFPGIEIILFEGTDDEVKEWILSRAVDVGVVPLPCHELDTMAIAHDEFLAVVSDTHPLAQHPQIGLRQLANVPFILSNAGCKPAIMQMFRHARVKPRIQFEVVDSRTIFAMVQEGMGITIVPEMTLPNDLTHLHLLRLDPPPQRDLALAVLSHDSATPAVQVFLQQAQDWAYSQNFL
ncbi:MAG: LysR family transcriptional regulator [Elainellaceae cyanobacterium]